MAATQLQSKTASLEEITRDILVALGNGEKLDRVIPLLLANKSYLATALAAAAPLPQDGTPYSRKIIYNGPEGEAMIAHWPAGKTCSPHDHGEARGVVTILLGDFLEQAYRISEDSLKKTGHEHRYVLGDVLPVMPQMIHSMRAESEGVTLHLYAPPIREMKVYDQHTVYTVNDNCGAWVPSDSSLILRREPIGSNPLHN
jgi:hypothetical protein